MNKKSKIPRSIIFIFIIAAIVGLVFLWNQINDYSRILKANWGFKIPLKSHYSEVYTKDSGASFNGDGIRYHVFSYKEDGPIREMFDWKNREEKTIFYPSYKQAVSEWLASIDVPSHKLTNYFNSLYWYGCREDKSEIIVVWNPNKDKLYIVESFL